MRASKTSAKPLAGKVSLQRGDISGGSEATVEIESYHCEFCEAESREL